MNKYVKSKKGGTIVLFGYNLYALVSPAGSPLQLDSFGNSWCELRDLKTGEIVKASTQVIIPLTLQQYMRYKKEGKYNG